MNDPGTDNRPRRRRRSAKRPLKIISDIGLGTPVTQAEIDLIITMLGGHEGMQRILRGIGVRQASCPNSDAPEHAGNGMQKT